ncbi:MAG: CocE/NonD family hydrolase [Candidatus Sumerlaeia bacterium]|nr:CocE/NonD family hydrolase [Candidatus Sumerlaeia bacterium]
MSSRINPSRAAKALLAAASLFVFVPAAHAVVHSRTPAQIPMRDAQSLAADVYLPPGEGPWPTVLIQTPYEKFFYIPVFTTEFARDPLLKSPDYAFVTLDWRGFGDSAGAAYQGAPTRGEDGFDAVGWIASQPWSDGQVATWGASALGTVQLMTALQRPPALRACVPMVCHYGERYGIWYRGGVYYKNRNDFVADFYGFGDIFRDRPLRNFFWDATEAAIPSFDGIETPMLFVSGWYDHETQATIDEFARLRAAQGPGSPTRLLIGPWSHSAIDRTEQGQRAYPAAEFASSTAALAFFDRHLRGAGGAATAPVTLFQMNEDRWLAFDSWPPTGTQSAAMHLAEGGLLADAPGASATVSYASDPLTPVPSLFGAILREETGGTQGPGDLSPLVGRADTLYFETAPLAEPLRLAGSQRAVLRISADAPDVDLAVRLVEVPPGGERFLVAEGMRRASLRDSFEAKALLQPGDPVEVAVATEPTMATIPAGHRLGVLVASTNFDLFEPNPQDGSDYLDSPGAAPRGAAVELRVGGADGSRLELSVLPQGSAVDGWMLF